MMFAGEVRILEKLRIAWFLGKNRAKIKRIFRHLAGVYTSQELLEMAQRAVLKLRDGENNTDATSSLDEINTALELGWNYRKIGTTSKEVIEFRNGKSQKYLPVNFYKNSVPVKVMRLRK